VFETISEMSQREDSEESGHRRWNVGSERKDNRKDGGLMN